MSERIEFCQLALQPDANISALCRQFKVSRKTAYKWLDRYDDADLESLGDRSRRPLNSPGATDAETVSRIIALRRARPYYGARKLRVLLSRELSVGELPSAVTIARILRRQGLIEPRGRGVESPALQRFERSAPNELWQMDLKGPIRLGDGRKVYPAAILDDHSRYLLTLRLLPGFEEGPTLEAWIEAAHRHGLPEATLTDHGPQFRNEDHITSAFRVHLWACDVVHTQGRIRHPQTQGKVERFWRTLKDEVLSRRQYADYASWQACFDDWRQEYNERRPHQGLDEAAPSTRYHPSARLYREPDRRARIGQPDSIYRRVNHRAEISLSGKRFLIGRGFNGWTVELRPLATGCWHVYFRGHFIKELLVTIPSFSLVRPDPPLKAAVYPDPREN
jgi:transposase InsO family protein